jgi:hypothetical protein
MIISETPTHIVVAVEVSKATLALHRRFLDQLIRLTTEGGER